MSLVPSANVDRGRIMPRSVWLASLAVAALIAVGANASVALAAAPSIGTFTYTDTYVDDGLTAVCGFPVTSTATTSGTFEAFFDQSGNLTRVQIEQSSSGTFTANGRSVDQTSHQVSLINKVDGTETDVGIIIHVSIPGGGTLFLDRGLLMFDSGGNLLFEAGPHPSFDGDVPAGFCAALQ